MLDEWLAGPGSDAIHDVSCMAGGCVNGIKAARTYIVASQPTDGWIGREEVYELTLRTNAEITWKRSNVGNRERSPIM